MFVKFFSMLFLLGIIMGGIFSVSVTPVVFAVEPGGQQIEKQGTKQVEKKKTIKEEFVNFSLEQVRLLFDGLDAYGSFIVIGFFIILLIFFVASLTLL